MLCISVRALQFCCSLMLLFVSKSNPSAGLTGRGDGCGTGCARAEPSLKCSPANCSLLFLGHERVGSCCGCAVKERRELPEGTRKSEGGREENRMV